MLARSKALHHAAKSCTLELGFATLFKRNATKTTKTFSELPSVFMCPDGTAALPLREWRAGLERMPMHVST